jgi:DNA polymerase III delta subunit
MVTRSRSRSLKWNELRTHLAKQPPAGWFAFCGPESFLKGEALEMVKAALRGQGSRQQARYAVDTFVAGEAPVQEISTAACQAGLFGGERLLLIEGIDRLSRAGKRDKQTWLDLTGRPAAHPVILLTHKTSRELTQKARFFADLLGPVVVVDFWPLYPRDAQRWATQRAAQRGLRLSAGVAAFLVERVGTDLQMLSQELEKISLMHPDGELDLPALRKMLHSGLLGSSWQCVEAIVRGTLAESLERLQSVRREESSFSFMWKLSYSASHAVDRSDGAGGGWSGGAGGQPQPAPPLSPAQKHRLANLIEGCYEWERTLKGGGWIGSHDYVALERLIIDHARSQPGGRQS